LARAIVKRIRVLIDVMPRLLRDVIEGAVSLQADMQLIDAGASSDLCGAVRASDADVVIVADETAAGDSTPEELLLRNPQLKVFVVTAGGRDGHLLEFRRMTVEQMSPGGLVAAIRAAVA
jgi:hypothetical protein